MSNLSIRRLNGANLADAIENLAKLRFTVFREYPYLYDGELDYEMDYLNTYLQCPQAVLIAAYDKDDIVGASTAIPIEFESTECQKPFIDSKQSLKEIFYFGESVLLPQYRKQGVYRHFFNEREAAAREYGSKVTTFCAVKREPNDKRRPKDYVPLDAVWRHFGYQQHPELCAYYPWKEIDNEEKTLKPMIFWMKTL